MKAARFWGINDLRVEDVPDPVPAEGEVLLAPKLVGVCGTDSHILAGHYTARPPMVLGHEISAEVVALGKGVDDLRVGQLVTVENHKYCTKCIYCRLGKVHMCVKKEAYGVHLDGGMAELMAIPARVAYAVPASVSPELASFTEPVACCVHAMDRLAPSSGLPIAIFGCGPAGSILIALARMAGLFPIVGIDPRAERRELAERMGADIALDPKSPDFDDEMRRITSDMGFPFAVDAVGNASIVEQIVPLVSRAARILVFGVARPGSKAAFDINDIYARELTILGTAINPYTHARAVALLERLPLHHFRTRKFRLDDTLSAIRAQESGAVEKAQIVPTGL